MKNVILRDPIVTVSWLHDHLDAPNLVVLDASIPKVTGNATEGGSEKIPNARFFDLKNKFSDAKGNFPNTFPSEEQFNAEARKLGINNDSAIVFYDDLGIYSSARPWYMFKAFGYNNVAVLNGGLPEWIKQGFETASQYKITNAYGNFVGVYDPQYMKFFEDVKKECQDKNHTIVDARSYGRFHALVAEPRAGLRSGNIPNSVNLPFEDLLEDGILKPKGALENIYNSIAAKDDQITFSCGSGITACVLALGADILGYKHISVYDGSWTEWGSLTTE